MGLDYCISLIMTLDWLRLGAGQGHLFARDLLRRLY